MNKVSQNEAKKLLRLGDDLAGSVIGQQEAVDKVAAAIKRNRVGLRKKNRPIGSFIFLGSTGIGKTELAKALANRVFGSDEALIRIDMSEYQQEFSVSRLIGAPPVYIGYNEGGQLTEKVRTKPYSVILLDEIEKAHPKIFDLFLQLLDDGHLTDGSGRQVNFKNTIVIMTSNIGVRTAQNFGVSVGFSTTSTDQNKRERELISKEMKKYFRPEFLNRVDDIVFFNKLSQNDILEIVKLQFQDLVSRVGDGGNILEIGEGVAEYIAKEGFSEDMGAREMQRTILKKMEDPMTDAILDAGMPPEAKIYVTMTETGEEVKVKVEYEKEVV